MKQYGGKYKYGLWRKVTAQESALCIKIVNDRVVEVNIKYGGKYLDLKEMKGRTGC
jgi:hypothetical protein